MLFSNFVLFAKRFFVILSRADMHSATLFDNKPHFYRTLGNYGSVVVKQLNELMALWRLLIFNRFCVTAKSLSQTSNIIYFNVSHFVAIITVLTFQYDVI